MELNFIFEKERNQHCVWVSQTGKEFSFWPVEAHGESQYLFKELLLIGRGRIEIDRIYIHHSAEYLLSFGDV